MLNEVDVTGLSEVRWQRREVIMYYSGIKGEGISYFLIYSNSLVSVSVDYMFVILFSVTSITT